MTKRQNRILIIFFLLMIFGFTITSLFKPDTQFSETENRELAQAPQITLENVLSGKFSTDYETYLTDQFVFRDQWIGAKTLAERAIGKQEVNDIYFAADDYLIEKHTGSFDTDTAQRNITYLASFLEDQTARLGTEHVKAMIVPNAVDTLKDKLPPFADSTAEDTYLQQIAEALPAGSFVDLQPVLGDHKEEYIYYRTDHHWTTLGAWYAYEAWCRAAGIAYTPQEAYQRETLSEEFYGTVAAKVNISVPADTIEAWKPLAAAPYTVRYNHGETAENTLYDESYLQVRDKYAVFFGGNQPLTEIVTENTTGRKLLVIKDSYANCFVPFAVQDFDAIAMADMRYFNEHLSTYIEENGFTDVLVLYNAAGFAEDTSLAKLAL